MLSNQQTGIYLTNDRFYSVRINKQLLPSTWKIIPRDFSIKNQKEKPFYKQSIIFGSPCLYTLNKSFVVDLTCQFNEIIAYLKTHSMNFFGYPLKALYYDFLRIPISSSTQFVNAFAIPHQSIDPFIEFFSENKAKMKAVDLIANALLRVVRLVAKCNDQFIAVVYSNSEKLHFWVFHNHHLYFQIKHDLQTKSKSTLEASVKEALVSSLATYKKTDQAQTCSAIYILAESSIRHLLKTIIQQISTPCYFLDPLFNHLFSENKIELIIAYGLALWGKKINEY